jgi:uncharacterized protein
MQADEQPRGKFAGIMKVGSAWLLAADARCYGLIKPYKKPYFYIDTFSFPIYYNFMSKRSDFEWDSKKDKQNQEKHGVSFALAQLAFLDTNRVILEDLEHSENEKRFYCLGRVSDAIMTVRFTYIKNKIRIIGAGYWRKGKKIYERENKIHGRTNGEG